MVNPVVLLFVTKVLKKVESELEEANPVVPKLELVEYVKKSTRTYLFVLYVSGTLECSV